MVMNVGRFLSADTAFVRDDIAAVTMEAASRNAAVKVILETACLSAEQIEAACRICAAAGADFVKTSTGFGPGPATPEAVAVMVRTVGASLGVKASGGIRTYEQAAAFLDQGCRRLGTSATEAILAAAPEAD
jgi:deoxyribose-phosphate aldolase